MRLQFLLLLILVITPAFAQLSDNFTDGDFTNNPIWSGDTDSHLVTATGLLQSNGPTATTSIALSTPNSQYSNTEWFFYVNLAFSPSDANHARIYLMSDQADMKSPLLNGYYVRIGENGSNDGVDLWRQQGSSITKIMSGLPGTVAVNPTVRIRVIRNDVGYWQVWADPTGGNDLVLQGSATDNTLQETAFFGISCFQTTTNRQKFSFDDFVIRKAPIALNQAIALSATRVQVQFSQVTQSPSSTLITNYHLDHGIDILQANPDATHASLVTLVLGTPLNEAVQYTLTVNDIEGGDGSMIFPNSTAQFRYTVPVQDNDLVITEVFADENPRVGLPDAEFVELYNRNSRSI
jgi:hypothetical protein